MGYASLSQIGTGLRQRIYSRAFIVGSLSDPSDRFVYLILDTQSGDTAVRYGILEALANLGSDYAMYNQSNVAVTGTHSHSGPGAWVNYLLPQVTSLGFDKQSYQAIVDGAVLSIQRAHGTSTPTFNTVKQGLLNWT
jgi:neutral ceramidase